VKISGVVCYPLTTAIDDDQQRTSQGSFGTISIIVVELRTDEGLVGYGEGLARYAPRAYKTLVDELLAPRLLGEDPFDAGRLWHKMFRAFTGRSGGVLMEAIAAVDIALWDLMGKALGKPVSKLLGGMGRSRVHAYASSIAWASDEVAVDQTKKALKQGFDLIKVKIGGPADAAIRRCRLIRETAPAKVRLAADANWAFDYDDAVKVARALADLDYYWFEEPIVPEDLDGYRRLRAQVPIRFAAGESEHTAAGAAPLISSRAIGLIQPDVARSGGITETRNIAGLAAACHVGYAPHVGASGAVCAAASLHLAAAMPNFVTFECMVFKNPLRERLTKTPVGDPDTLVDSTAEVPAGPGLGVEIDFDVLERYRVG
jgi:galactonate dehydratase